jgi:hypothetical protein
MRSFITNPQIKNPPCQPGTGFLALAVFDFASGRTGGARKLNVKSAQAGNYPAAGAVNRRVARQP